ncbi:MAG: hypothetical protein ACRDJW_16550 [Thermomicrobiales bacterium]
MNPYLAAGLAMCAIVIVALALTAYMAMIFNRRAKVDLERALTPLAAVIDGEMDLDDAKVTGRFRGQIAEGWMSASLTNPGRVFHTSVIDATGGAKWTWTYARPRKASDSAEAQFDSADDKLETAFFPEIDPLLLPVREGAPWTVVEYDPDPGHIRLTRPMQTRRDLPSVGQFEADLNALIAIAGLNRAVQFDET